MSVTTPPPQESFTWHWRLRDDPWHRTWARRSIRDMRIERGIGCECGSKVCPEMEKAG